MHLIKTLAACLFLIIPLMGCNSGDWLTGRRAEPVTRFSVNPLSKTFSFEDSKNNNVSIKGMKFSKSEGVFEVEEVTIINNSSEVIAADTARLAQVLEMQKTNVELHRAIGNNIAMALAAGGEAAANFISKLPNLNATVDTPIGGGNLSITQPVPAILPLPLPPPTTEPPVVVP